MKIPSKSEQLYLKYLLHQLPAEERERIDASLIEGQELSDSFQAARLDLLDAYAAKELSPEIRRQVEQGILSAPDGYRALSVATSMQSARKIPNEAPAQHRSFRIKLFTLALAACGVMAFVLVRQYGKNPTPIYTPRTSSAQMEAKIPPNATNTQAVAPPNPTVNGPTTLHRHSFAGAGVMAFVLPQGNSRGAVAIPLQIHAGTVQVHVEWPLPSDAHATHYSLELSSEGHEVASIPQQTPLVTMGTTQVATFVLRSATLPNGIYVFRLQASDLPEPKNIAEYSVRVTH